MAWNRTSVMEGFAGNNLLEIGISASRMRFELHPEAVVTYELHSPETTLAGACRESALHSSSNVNLLQIRDIHGVALKALSSLFDQQLRQYPALTFHQLPFSALSAVADDAAARDETLQRLHAVGLRSFSADLYPAEETAASHRRFATFLRAAAGSFFVSVSVIIGNAETIAQRADAMTMLRSLQDESHAIGAVAIRIHHAATPEARREEEATAVDYLKTLAIARLSLDNIEHLQADWTVMGPKVLELALRFGANDAGSIPRSQARGPEPAHHGGEGELRRLIRDAGFRPVERDALFRQCLLH